MQDRSSVFIILILPRSPHFRWYSKTANVFHSTVHLRAEVISVLIGLPASRDVFSKT